MLFIHVLALVLQSTAAPTPGAASFYRGTPLGASSRVSFPAGSGFHSSPVVIAPSPRYNPPATTLVRPSYTSSGSRSPAPLIDMNSPVSVPYSPGSLHSGSPPPSSRSLTTGVIGVPRDAAPPPPTMHINAGDDFTVNPLFSQTGPPAGESALLSRRPAVGEHAETQRVLPDQVIGIPKGLGKLSLKPNGNPAAPRSSDPSAQVPARQGAADLLMPPAATGAKRTEANTASGDSVQPVRQPGDDTRDSVLTPGDQAALIKSDTNAPEPLKFLSKRTGYIVGAQFLAGAVMAGAGLLIYKGTSKHEKEIAEKAMAKYEKQSQNATDKMAAALAGAPKQAEEQQAVLDERTAQYQAYADETKASNDAVETKIVTWGP